MRQVLTAILALSLLWVSPARSTDKSVAPDIAVPLFLKILSYDQSFAFDQSKSVDLYLPYDKADAASYEQYRAARGYFQKNPDVTVYGAKVRFLPICCDSMEQVMGNADPEHYNILVLTTMAQDKTHRLVELSRSHGLRTYALDFRQLTLGVSVGIRPTDAKSAIVVNRPAAELEGTRFSAQFLRLCEILDEEK